MEQLTDRGDGWINVLPSVADDDETSTTIGFFTMLSGGGSGLVMCSWIPARAERRPRAPAALGIAHLVGRRVVGELVEKGRGVPAGWFVEQDHPRRGLVVRVPPDEPHRAVLGWAVGAVAALSSADAALRWRADVYLPLH